MIRPVTVVTTSAAAPSTSTTTTTTARMALMTEEETAAIFKKSSDCLEKSADECSIEEVDELLKTLKDAERQLRERLEDIEDVVAGLEDIHDDKKEDRRRSGRQFVKDMLRVFNNDKPSFPVSGYSGDVGRGAKTAYDVLPPKKWVNPDKE